MRKVWFGGILLALLLMAANSSSVSINAQDKKDTKKVEAAPAAGTIEITEGKDGKFRFYVRDGEGKLLALSGPTGYATVKEAQTAIDEMKAIVAKAKVKLPDATTKPKDK